MLLMVCKFKNLNRGDLYWTWSVCKTWNGTVKLFYCSKLFVPVRIWYILVMAGDILAIAAEPLYFPANNVRCISGIWSKQIYIKGISYVQFISLWGKAPQIDQWPPLGGFVCHWNRQKSHKGVYWIEACPLYYHCDDGFFFTVNKKCSLNKYGIVLILFIIYLFLISSDLVRYNLITLWIYVISKVF